MIWQAWRQHRAVALLSLTALCVVEVGLIILGLHLYQGVDALEIPACASLDACQADLNALGGWANAFHNASLALLAAPALVGLFVGAPLIAREYEQRTYQMAWTQGVTRRRWFVVQAALLGLGVALGAGILAATMSWAEQALVGAPEPIASTVGDGRFSAWGFDLSGIVPVAYALFSLALGTAAGALLRRTLPSVAVTLAGLLVVRLPIAFWLRPRFEAPLVATGSIASDTWTLTLSPSDWIVEQGYLHNGHRFAGGIEIPQSCTATTTTPTFDGLGQCLQAHGWSQYLVYQPADRFWLFQGVESVIFLLLAAALMAGALLLVMRRST